MNRNTFARAYEVAEASGLLEKSASIAAGRGLTGAAAVKYAASAFIDDVNRLADELDNKAQAYADRVAAKLDAARPLFESTSELTGALKGSGLELEAFLDHVLSQQDESSAEADADFILGAGR